MLLSNIWWNMMKIQGRYWKGSRTRDQRGCFIESPACLMKRMLSASVAYNQGRTPADCTHILHSLALGFGYFWSGWWVGFWGSISLKQGPSERLGQGFPLADLFLIRRGHAFCLALPAPLEHTRTYDHIQACVSGRVAKADMLRLPFDDLFD